MFFWARPFFSSPRPAHVFQARPMRPPLSLWPFSPLTHRPTPLRRARSELRPRAAAAPCVPSAVSLGWATSSPSFLSFPRCLSVSPFLLHGATPSSPDRHRARRCRVAVGRLDLPFSVSHGHQPDPSPALFSPYGLTPATPELAGCHALPHCLPVSCPRAASSFSWDIDARAPQPRPRPSCPKPVRHLILSVPEPVIPIELQVAGTP
jgi:hypothetical protein